jgi:capsular exopolysaccharide synthesis family protein
MKSVVHTVSLDSLELSFQHYWLILKRRWRPAASIFGATLLITALGASLQKPIYKAEGKLLFKTDRTPSLTGVGTEIEKVSPLTLQSNPTKTEAEVILSIPLMQRTIAALKLRDKQGNLLEAETLIEKLNAKNISGTDVLQLSYESKDPDEAAAVVNKLMFLYLANNVLVNQSEAAAARKFIAEQLPLTESSVRQADASLRKFKEENNITDLAGEGKSALATISNLENQITKAQADLADENTRYAGLRSKLGINSGEAIAGISLSQSPGVQQVLRELQQVESQLQVQRTRYQEQNPVIVDLSSKQAALKALLQERVTEQLGGQQQLSNGNLQIGNFKQKLSQDFINSELERLSLTNRIAVLSNALAFYKQRVSILPKLEQDQRELQRKLEAAQSTYQTLLKNLQEVQVTEKQNMGNARIIESALVPKKPLNTNKLIVLVLGFLLASLFATGTIVFLELSDTSIKTLQEVRKLFGYTVLGNIPYFGKQMIPRGKNPEWPTPELPVRDIPRSHVSAAYRMLQANLKFISLDKELQIVVVTSSVPKEGKSTVSANLSASMAQLGHRVLLVDADMHRPSQHHIWNLTNATGLSNIIVDKVEFNIAVEKVMDNLDVLTSGVIPPNPLAILDSRRMASLVKSFSNQYDFVIIDTPPLVEAEALTLGKISDGVLLVVRPGIVDFASATNAKELLQQSAQNTLGLIINGATQENEFVYTQVKELDKKEYSGLAT